MDDKETPFHVVLTREQIQLILAALDDAKENCDQTELEVLVEIEESINQQTGVY